jgi:hypothetical protein
MEANDGVSEFMIDRPAKLLWVNLIAMIHALVEYNNCS